MDLQTTIPNLHHYLLKAAFKPLDADSEPHKYEERACAQNFLLDERPPPEALDLYKPHFASGPVSDFDDWYARHHGFALKQLFLGPNDADVPLTFRPVNHRNQVTRIDSRLNLIRIEEADSDVLRGHAFEEVADQIEKFQGGNDAARGFLQDLCNDWNAERDRRPAYVTTEIGVEDILVDGVTDWVTRLRNRLGLGHLDPNRAGRLVEILVMRYPVAEAVAALDGWGHPTIPTVLDGDLCGYFFPTPLPGPDATEAPPYGRTVNLTPIENDNNYEMSYELLTPSLVYRPEHFYRAGIVAEPVTMPLDLARGFHLPWVRIDAGRGDDFGAKPLGKGEQ